MKIAEFENGIAQAYSEPPHLDFESLNSQYMMIYLGWNTFRNYADSNFAVCFF